MKLTTTIYRELNGAEVEVLVTGRLCKADPAAGYSRPYVSLDSWSAGGVDTHPDDLSDGDRAEALEKLEYELRDAA